jgi:hypothetical protein
MASQLQDPGVYDPEKEDDQSRDDLGSGHDRAAGDSSDPRGEGPDSLNRDALRDAEEEGGLNPSGDTETSTSTGSRGGGSTSTDKRASRDSGNDDESEDKEGKGDKGGKGKEFTFNPHDRSDRGSTRKVLRAANKHKKLMLIGTGLSTGVIGLIVAVFFVLIPLKIEHIVTNLQNRFFSSSENAVDKQSENLLSDYVKKYVMPALTRCSGSSIDKNCNPAFGKTSNPVDALYKGWSQARLENKLAENYGIEFRYNKYNRRYYMKVPGITNPKGDDITSFVDPHNRREFDKDLFTQVSRGQVREAVSTAFANESKWKKVMYRYKVGRLLEEKYGIERCLIYCEKRDELAAKIADQKIAAQLYLINRVITPRTKVLGVVMECLIDPSCNPEKTEPTVATETSTSSGSNPGTSTTTTDGTVTITTGSEEAGAPKDLTFDARVLEEFAAERGSLATAEQLEKAYKDISDNSYQKYILKEILAKLHLGDLAGTAVDSANVIQWVNTAANLTVDMKKAGPSVTKLSYVTNASADIKIFSMYRTYADEIHTGHVTATEVGSLVKSLGPISSTASKKDLVGGTASAEETPLFNNLITRVSTTTGSSSYTCANHKSPGSSLICSEEKLGGSNAATGISNLLSTPPLSYISDIASAWHSVVGGIFNFVGNVFGSIIGSIPGINSITSFISSAAQPFFNFLTNKLIPNPFSSNMSGGRTFDLMAVGADVAGNDFAHEGLGGKVVSATTAATIAAEQDNKARQEFSHQSIFARLFSTDSQYSLISNIAMDIPFDTQGSAESSFASLASNPLGALMSSFASIFSGSAKAGSISGVVDGHDFANVTQYEPEVVAHPGDYWNKYCSDDASNAYMKNNDWNKAASQNINPETGQPDNTSADPCLTIKAAICADGATSDASLCTPDDLADANGGQAGSATAPSSSSGYQNPFHDMSGLTYIRVDEGVDFATDGRQIPVYAIGNGTVTQVKKGDSTFYPPLPNWITYQLNDGSAKGKYVYVAEDCPPLVKIGDTVSPTTGPLCNTRPGSIETGWAMDATSQAAAAHDVYSEGHATAYGQNFEELLNGLGVGKACYDHPGERLEGSLPSGWPTWVSNPATTAGSNGC